MPEPPGVALIIPPRNHPVVLATGPFVSAPVAVTSTLASVTLELGGRSPVIVALQEAMRVLYGAHPVRSPNLSGMSMTCIWRG